MLRRHFLLSAGALCAAPALAHHGWSSFDQDKPLYLAGRIRRVRWQNPHAEAFIEVAAGLALPADFARRSLPAQSQSVDAPGLLRKVTAPDGAAGEWELEFAPLFRMEAWGLREPLVAGDAIEVIGYTGVPGKPRLMRVEYLFARGRVAGLRSMPAG